MNKSFTAIAAALCLAFGSCVAVSHLEYTPPPELEALPQHERIVDAGFDETWTALITSVGRSFFAIDEFEKASGLLTLDFTASPFSNAVTGGQCKFFYDNSDEVDGEAFWVGTNKKKVKIQFEGDYADYVEAYLNGMLAGSVNLIVTKVSDVRTKITVNTRFVVTTVGKDGPAGGYSRTTWSWNSGGRSSQVVTTIAGDREVRVLQSTNYVEGKILGAIDEIFAMAE